MNSKGWHRDALLAAVFVCLTIGLYFVPNQYEKRTEDNGMRCRGRVVQVDNSDMRQYGMVWTGDQGVTLKLLDGKFAGQTVSGNNPLMGQMDRDKIFQVGDTALVVLSLDSDGNIIYVNPQAHYRLGLEMWLLGIFTMGLLAFGGWTGAKALLSFIFSALMLWKVLVPLMLDGYDPVWLSLSVITILTASIIFLVAGISRKGLVAFLGAFLGILTSCILAVYFTGRFHVHGAVMPFAETLLYAGYGHLNLQKIYVAAVFLAASGAVMDLAMDVAASMHEVVAKKPDIGRLEALRSGMRVGRAVVGTMTTTLLLAYSGGFITMLMAFVAQGIPLTNLFNFIYVAAEVLKTLVGSFGLVTVAPFTAIVGALIYVPGKRKARVLKTATAK
ncbi:MAG: YibE/F family protein [Desulfovibrio sp.]|uniref:YibE/F family protein n=1 Tax=Desulfovibrio sp. 7SRBS1 TaxID=3378064 RepID=UPI003B42762F